MPPFQFNSQGVEPQYGGSGGLPMGKHPVVIVATALKPTKNNDGGFLELTLQAIDGPAKGLTEVDRLNLHNKNAQAVEIANKQLAAYCHVTGVFAFNSTEELHNKPFVVEIGPRKDNPQQGEVKALFDMNGNEPGKAGSGPQGGGAGFGGGAPPPPPPPPAWNGGGAPATGDQGQGGQGGGQGGQGGGWGTGGQGGGAQAGGGAAGGGAAPGWAQGGQGGGQGGGAPWGGR